MGSVAGGLLGGKKSSSTTSTTLATLPDWLQNPLKDLITQSTELSAKPYEAYTGDRLAGFNQDELAAFDLYRQMGQNPLNLDPAKDIANEVANRGLNGFSQQTLDQYMNPYAQNVTDIGRRKMFEAYDQQKNQADARAAQAGAFGGSRFGLQSAQQSRDFQQGLSDYTTQQLSAAYNDAQNRALAGTQLASQSGQNLSNYLINEQQGQIQQANALGQAGSQQRALTQAGLDQAYQDWATEQSYPYQQLQFQQSMVNPAAQLMRGQTTTQTQSQSGGSGLLGTAIGLGSMAMGVPGISSMMTSGLGSMGLGSMGYGLAGMFGSGSTALSNGQNINWFKDGGVVRDKNKYADGGVVERINGFMDGVLSNYAQPQYIDSVQPYAPMMLEEEAEEDDVLSLNSKLKDFFKRQGDEKVDANGTTRNERLEAMAAKAAEYQAQNHRYPASKESGDLDLLTRMIVGEARGQGDEGMKAVAYVAKNRSDRTGKRLSDVLTEPKQFSTFNKDDPNYDYVLGLSDSDPLYIQARQIAEDVLSGKVTDPTKGATHYVNPATASKTSEGWRNKLSDQNGYMDIGPHRFYTDINYGGTKKYAKGGNVSIDTELVRIGDELLPIDDPIVQEYLAQKAIEDSKELYPVQNGIAKLLKGTGQYYAEGGQVGLGGYSFGDGSTTMDFDPSAIPALLRDVIAKPTKQGLNSLLENIKADGPLEPSSPVWEGFGNAVRNVDRAEYNAAPAGSSRAEKMAVGLGNLPLAAGKGAVNTLAGAGRFGDFLFGPSYGAEESVTQEAVDSANTPAKQKAIYEAQQRFANNYVPQALAATKTPEQVAQPIMEAASKSVSEAPRGNSQPAGVTEGPAPSRSLNIPLITFGATLMGSDNDFFKAFGEAAKAGISTKANLDKAAREDLREQAKLQLDQYKSDLYGMQVGAQIAKANDPYARQLQMFKILKAQNDATGVTSMNKAAIDLAKSLVSSGQAANLEEAMKEARKAVMTFGVMGNLEDGESGELDLSSLTQDDLANLSDEQLQSIYSQLQ